MPAAYELRQKLDSSHRITVVNAVGWRIRDAIPPVEVTPIATGTPETGYMIEPIYEKHVLRWMGIERLQDKR
ncbi:MAG: hypothetical protein ACYDCF_06260 [Burkholderiales bacterium]